MFRNVSVAFATCVLWAGVSYGSLVGDAVDIRVELGNSGFLGDFGPRVFEHLGVTVDDSVELTLANEASNPSGYIGAVDVDVDGALQLVTVSTSEIIEALGYADFREIEIWITDLDWIGQPGFVTGVEIVSDNLIGGPFSSDPFTVEVDFTADSIHIVWDGVTQDDIFEIGPDGLAVFSFTVGHAVVPEPATVLLLGAGLGGLVLRRRFLG